MCVYSFIFQNREQTLICYFFKQYFKAGRLEIFPQDIIFIIIYFSLLTLMKAFCQNTVAFYCNFCFFPSLIYLPTLNRTIPHTFTPLYSGYNCSEDCYHILLNNFTTSYYHVLLNNSTISLLLLTLRSPNTYNIPAFTICLRATFNQEVTQ